MSNNLRDIVDMGLSEENATEILRRQAADGNIGGDDLAFRYNFLVAKYQNGGAVNAPMPGVAPAAQVAPPVMNAPIQGDVELNAYNAGVEAAHTAYNTTVNSVGQASAETTYSTTLAGLEMSLQQAGIEVPMRPLAVTPGVNINATMPKYQNGGGWGGLRETAPGTSTETPEAEHAVIRTDPKVEEAHRVAIEELKKEYPANRDGDRGESYRIALKKLKFSWMGMVNF